MYNTFVIDSTIALASAVSPWVRKYEQFFYKVKYP